MIRCPLGRTISECGVSAVVMTVTEGTAVASSQPSLSVRNEHPFTAIASAVIVILSILCGLATYLILTGLAPIKPNRELIGGLMAANLLLVSLMAGMIGWQIWKLLRDRQRGIAGAGLHIRIVGLFSLIAALPAIIVALFATVTLSRGLDTWFSDRTRSVVDSSVAVAQSYIRETSERIRDDVVSISNDLNQHREMFEKDSSGFVKRVATHAALRGLSAVYVMDRARKYLDVSVTASSKVHFKPPKEEAFEKAESGELVILPPGEDNFIRALIKLTAYDGRYLYISRDVDTQVLRQLEKARESKLEFDQMLNQRQGVQLTFALVYAGVALIFLLSAVWLGLWFADRLVEPIINLVNASRKVSLGDLDAKVPMRGGPGDLATLGRTFNLMTDQLKSQHDALMNVNHQLDERRRFTEAMLAGVSAGVIGVDPSGRIDLVNRSAIQLLQKPADQLIGKFIADAIVPFASLVEQASHKPSGMAEGQLGIKAGMDERSLFVRVTTENQTDPQIFEQCTNTIIRQVGDIGRMVDEFSSFARMPSAVLESQDLAQVVKEATILQRVSASDLAIEVDIPDHSIMLSIDRRLVSQAVTNLVKNAREAIEARQKDEPGAKGVIKVEIEESPTQVCVTVTDNGVGLPVENRHRLTEPYMTTREKGTGLGLAIVKRIMEEHGGRLILHDAPINGGEQQGAQVRLIFNREIASAELSQLAGK